ncbi:MAG: hypothetical protein UR85_C0002G0006 [Candidatus Nomurabacteria bacterium GW2011_GWF2_35_66]|uniref:Uncharacterized protein n=1 Tax=Candidatus Nomurabacteria bacterium GW2011_GWE1_35_16 TaxID=1618761 RepID=A0A0G0BAY8_9BACT|nr:MAG: hypothetical protein UR55_C0007G0036 [Candidatus Nomurabacteria bacterium GW2011_GWF1_34_20]KKP63311.1 MAG: hypothetical protein UR57_C0006G0036 [Candidatus Nomurabacteria bacterium GW2011_GWE2_34_25]KKP66509.1 MAG: hypothetical protein UR64_C0006G0036 [Candidatus Nomurabacteria bacterium GW2011_GWE1_35_16]KKP83693.1 MAG: hypothetical protein UR85_C0002G0006 [Candidatus Nomurabacteria bacterium GW2011_GWF2_35_66]HAE36945.1 hypothetical protein [Candidatus Nomurabacteria bacterium]
MNTFLLKIKNQIKRIKNFFIINPHKHWMFLVYIFFISILILILFSFYLLYMIKSEKIFQVKTEQSEKHVLLNEDLLKKTTDLYDSKAKKEAEIKNSLPPYKDPSI